MFEQATKQITPIAIWGAYVLTVYVIGEGVKTIADKIRTNIREKKIEKMIEEAEA